jgi:hypothetical protein
MVSAGHVRFVLADPFPLHVTATVRHWLGMVTDTAHVFGLTLRTGNALYMETFLRLPAPEDVWERAE